MLSTNRHRTWLKEARNLSLIMREGIDDGLSRTIPSLQDEIHRLQEKIIETKPDGKEDILAQIGLLGDLVWPDRARRLVTNLAKSIDDLWI